MSEAASDCWDVYDEQGQRRGEAASEREAVLFAHALFEGERPPARIIIRLRSTGAILHNESNPFPRVRAGRIE